MFVGVDHRIKAIDWAPGAPLPAHCLVRRCLLFVVIGVCSLQERATAEEFIELPTKFQQTHHAADFSPDGRLFAVAGGWPTPNLGHVTIWDVGTQEMTARIRLPTTCTSIEFAPNGEMFVVGSRDGAVYVYKLDRDREGREEWRLHATLRKPRPRGVPLDSGPTKTVFSPNGELVAATQIDPRKLDPRVRHSQPNLDVGIQCWSSSKRVSDVTVFPSLKRIVTGLAFRSDQRLLATGSIGHSNSDSIPAIFVLDPTSGTIESMRELPERSYSVAFDVAANAPRALVSGNDFLSVYNTEDLSRVSTFGVPKHHAQSCVAISPDGKLVVSKTGGAAPAPLYFWEAESGKLLRRYDEVIASTITFSPDGSLVGCVINVTSRPVRLIKVKEILAK